jgi:hypothetical protein
VAKRAAKPKRNVEVEVKPDAAPMPPPPRAGTLDEVIGQDRAVKRLREAVASGRLHHAWIFHGPVGVGKFRTALALGRELLTPRTGDLGASTRLLEAGTHPDLHVVTKELARVSSDEKTQDSKQRNIAKQVLEEFLTGPAHRTRVMASDSVAAKVFIVDEAELMEFSGQNSLLKTLEEPPPGTVIILITPQPDRLLPTIRSRCQAVAFCPLDDAACGAWMERHLAVAAPADRAFLVRFAGGAPGAAEVAHRSGVDAWSRDLEPMLRDADEGRFNPGLGPAISASIEAWAEARIKESPLSSKLSTNAAAARWMLRLLGDRYRRRLHEAAGAGSSDGMERASRAIALLDESERLMYNVQPVFVAEHLAMHLASRD